MKRRIVHPSIGLAAIALLLVLAPAGRMLAQDEGFDVIYEGVVDSATPEPEATLDLSLYGTAGFSVGGSFWAAAGTQAVFSIESVEIDLDASYGTDGLQLLAGAQTEIAGFGVGGDLSWSPGTRPVIDVRGWGTLGVFRLTLNVRLAGANTAVTISGTTDFEGFGLSANAGLAGGRLTQASVGANAAVGALSLSGSAGLAGGTLSVGGGAGLQIGAVSVIANAGYDGAIGLNATAGGTVSLDALEITAIGLYDNTGIGSEISGELGLGAMTATFMGRFSSGGLSVEVGARLPLGPATATFSVALDDQDGFSWAEIGFDMPL